MLHTLNTGGNNITTEGAEFLTDALQVNQVRLFIPLDKLVCMSFCPISILRSERVAVRHPSGSPALVFSLRSWYIPEHWTARRQKEKHVMTWSRSIRCSFSFLLDDRQQSFSAALDSHWSLEQERRCFVLGMKHPPVVAWSSGPKRASHCVSTIRSQQPFYSVLSSFSVWFNTFFIGKRRDRLNRFVGSICTCSL